MNNYNFRVIARIREDLNPQEKQYINDYLNEWKEKFEVKNIIPKHLHKMPTEM